MPAVPRKTGFFTRIKQVFTLGETPECEAQRKRLDEAIAKLKDEVAAGKLTQDELERRVAALKNGHAGP